MVKKVKKIAARFKPRVKTVISEDETTASSWRIFKILGEFVGGFEFLRRYDAAVTFFGSARCGPQQKMYKEATKLAKIVSKMGFAVITGGGPGIMEAANKGATEAKGVSVCLNIQLPDEQRINKYVKESHAFHYFFTRKVMLSYASEIYVVFPGGFGTIDELFELLTLVQTRKICPVPLILVGKEYWQPLLDWLENTMYEGYKHIDKADLKIFKLVDSAEEATKHIEQLIKDKKITTANEQPVEYTSEVKIQK